jgi:polar amino acid transport system substrate-binding protein
MRLMSMSRLAFSLLIVAFLASCSSTAVIPNAVVSDLAPTGKLRAAINFGNPMLAARDASNGELHGVSVDLSRELARRLGVPLELVPFNAAGRVVEAVKSGAWDVAYVAIDPLRNIAAVDRAGTRIGVGAGSAYDLFLSRELKQATLVRAPTSQAVTDLVIAQGLEVAAGVKQQLEADARRIPGMRLLEGPFMVINQAMGTPKGRDAGLRYLSEFIEEMKATGFVARALERHRIEGAVVAPAAR